MKPKHLSLLVIILLIPVCVWAWGIIGISGGVPSSETCLSGTYTLAWTGDYPADTDAACDSVQAKVDGTLSGLTVSSSYGESSNGALIDDVDEYISWTDAGDVYIDDAGPQTIWVRLFISAAPDNEATIFEAYNPADQDHYIAIRITDVGALRGFYKGDADGDPPPTAYSGTLGTGAWITVGYSWDFSLRDHSVYDDDGGWTGNEDVNELYEVFSSNATTISLGERYNGGGDPDTDNNENPLVKIDKIAIVDGYQVASPPW